MIDHINTKAMSHMKRRRRAAGYRPSETGPAAPSPATRNDHVPGAGSTPVCVLGIGSARSGTAIAASAICNAYLRLRLTTLFVLAALAASPATASAQDDCFRSWSRPVVCRLKVATRETGGRWKDLRRSNSLRLPAGGALELRFSARDQNGWAFPEERLRVGLDLERDCRDLVHLAPSEDGRYRLVAGVERGRCTATLWVPGNLNLDIPLRLEVVSRAQAGYDHAQARAIAQRLYLAILGREPDPVGWNAATQEIQRGRLSQQVRAMLQSPEFRSRQRRMSPSQFLESLYRSLLDREPDSQGVRTYLRRLERGQADGVIKDIIRSEEFEAILLEHRGKPSIHDVRPPR